MVWRFSGFQDGVIQAVETSKGRLCGHESLNYSGFTVEINWFSKLSRKLYIYRNGGFSIPMSVYWRIKATLKQSACLNRYPPKMDPLGIEKTDISDYHADPHFTSVQHGD